VAASASSPLRHGPTMQMLTFAEVRDRQLAFAAR
jgi:hypothetical protein